MRHTAIQCDNRCSMSVTKIFMTPGRLCIHVMASMLELASTNESAGALVTHSDQLPTTRGL